MTEATGQRFDYIIVGAGSAGCVLANRLSEAGDRVLLLEAGGSDRCPLITVPLGWGRILQKRAFDWGYFTQPEQNLNGREVECSRGRVLGGSSSINAMAYVRGHQADYNRWKESGLTGWGFSDVVPYFRKSEDWEEGEDMYRGKGGPLTTVRSRYADPLVDALLAAGDDAGHGITDDYNGVRNEGIARFQWTIRNGRRCNASLAYLRPAIGRPNLVLRTKVLATGVELEHGRAVGLNYLHGNRQCTAYADKEVILAGGVFNSPQLLMLSGIGDPAELARHGIKCTHELVGVGKNLCDHLSVGIENLRRGDGPFVSQLRSDLLLFGMARAYFFGTGFATEMPGPVTGFFKTDPALVQPDIQLLTRLVPPESQPWFPGVRPKPADAFMCRPVLLHPESRGEVKLRSSDPADHPAIFQNFLSREKDWQTLRSGIDVMRDLVSRKPMRKYADKEIQPGSSLRTRAEIDDFIRRTAWTAHHPLGTCKMGVETDKTAVVSHDLRVHGIDGLRVVDASVMPDMIGGNINATVMMIGERAADFLLGRAQLVPTSSPGAV
ncbi:MAG TPA: GMC family oxidoreductase N-terminal domain-containing protein [Roseovarius sp.]|nr:GMC family oxidoreductase N-terminal domain-containing protein [Roseovarius sp.]